MPLTVDEIVEIHTLLILRHGIIGGVRDLGRLETMVEYRLHAASNVFEEAAIILSTIAVDHPFFDGNKRTAFVAAVETIKSSGYDFVAHNDRVVSFVLAVARREKTQSEVENWLRENTVVRSDLAEPL